MSEEGAVKTSSIPFCEGLFTMEGGKAFLVGNQCSNCGQIYFPACSICFECENKHMQTIKFGSTGKLYSYAVSYMPSTHFEPPYAAGWIELPEGVRVFAPLKSGEGRSLDIGSDMVLTIGELWRNGTERVMGYAYETR